MTVTTTPYRPPALSPQESHLACLINEWRGVGFVRVTILESLPSAWVESIRVVNLKIAQAVSQRVPSIHLAQAASRAVGDVNFVAPCTKALTAALSRVRCPGCKSSHAGEAIPCHRCGCHWCGQCLDGHKCER